MNISGIGCDIVDIRRIENLMKEYEDRFLKRVFTEDEIKISKEFNNCHGYFAKRYAAKEAYAKASGYGISGNISFNSIEVLNDKRGMPYFNKHPLAQNGFTALLTLSDEYPYSMAYVIMMKK
ncbi:MAG: holo-[acyl-carrier protein] synthase [Candidatus Midichloriaceae bacterium]|jgi:holo-[acyl-carrier protein] synthase